MVVVEDNAGQCQRAEGPQSHAVLLSVPAGKRFLAQANLSAVPGHLTAPKFTCWPSSFSRVDTS